MAPNMGQALTSFITEGQTAVIWAVSAVGQERAARGGGQDRSGEGWRHPELLSLRMSHGDAPLRPAQPRGDSSAAPLGAVMGTGWAHRALKLPRENTAEPGGAGERACCESAPLPTATATLQPLRGQERE